jgi:hypothetical protein
MSDIDPLAGCGLFCSMWLLLLDKWEATALVLGAIGVIGLLWNSLRWRKLVMWVSFTLLVLHLGSAAYFNWPHP